MPIKKRGPRKPGCLAIYSINARLLNILHRRRCQCHNTFIRAIHEKGMNTVTAEDGTEYSEVFPGKVQASCQRVKYTLIVNDVRGGPGS